MKCLVDVIYYPIKRMRRERLWEVACLVYSVGMAERGQPHGSLSPERGPLTLCCAHQSMMGSGPDRHPVLKSLLFLMWAALPYSVDRA